MKIIYPVLVLFASTIARAGEDPGNELLHGLHYTKPAMVWDEALPLGNGILGALVWGDGQPLKISLDRTDLWDLRPVPEYNSPEYTYKTMIDWHNAGRHQDLVRLYEDPYSRAESPTKIPAGRIELTIPDRKFSQADLAIASAVASTQFDPETEVSVFVHASEPVGFIRVQGLPEISPKLIAPAFGGKGSLGKLGYPPPVETSGPNWRAFTQQGWGGFNFAVYLAWTNTPDNGWIAAWTVASSFESKDPLSIARERVEKAFQLGIDEAFMTHRRWWQKYWAQSSVSLPNETIERQWYLEQYKFGSASRRGAPPITLQGPWTADDGELPPWKGDYHHDLNTELSYWPCYSGNHLEEGLSYLDWLWKTRENCIDWTKRFFDMPGMNVPMTGDLNNSQIGGWRQYTHSATTAAWLAQHFYLHWKYSMDRDFLRDRAYPYLKDASVFIEAVSAKKGPDGKRTLALSASPEMFDNKPEAWFTKGLTNYDLALMRWLLGATAELADELKLPNEAKHWRDVLAEMPDFSRGDDGQLLIAPGQPLPFSHRHFSHLMAIHPLGLIDWSDGEQAQRTIKANLAELDRLGTDYWCGYSFAWLANLAARAHDGAKAETALELFSYHFTLRNSFHCNGDQSGKGYSKFTYRPFTLEGNFAAAAGIQEMLLQSHRSVIEVFPAIPDNWGDVSFKGLRAQGAFWIGAQRRGGTVQSINVYAEKGGTCKLISPSTGKELKLDMKAGQNIALLGEP